MAELSQRLQQAAFGVLAPADRRVVLVEQVILAVVAGALVCAAGPLTAVGMAAVVLVGAGLLLGPSRPVVGGFIIFMVVTHQYRSPFVFPFGGIEWHPRELVLIAVLAHWGVKLLQGKVRIEADPIHFGPVLLAFHFLLIALVGLVREPNVHRIIAECRYPIFLASYVVLISLVNDKRDLYLYIRIVFVLALLIAVAGFGFFAYTFVTGNVINTQNEYGEYVQRLIGGHLLQSVRPNGHMFFEISAVVLASLLFCPGVTLRRRALYACFIAIFAAAVLITMMRTAYATLFASLVILGFLALPNRRIQVWLAVFGLATAMGLLALFGAAMYMGMQEAMPNMGASIKGRLVEIAGAWRVFLEHPVAGAGMGGSFEGMGYVAKTSRLTYTEATYSTLHNVWMYYLFKGGIIGFVLAACGLGIVFVRGWQLIPQIDDVKERCLMRGLVAAWGGQLVASLAMPRLTYPMGYVLIGMMCCAFLVLGRAGPGDRRRTIPQRETRSV